MGGLRRPTDLMQDYPEGYIMLANINGEGSLFTEGAFVPGKKKIFSSC